MFTFGSVISNAPADGNSRCTTSVYHRMNSVWRFLKTMYIEGEDLRSSKRLNELKRLLQKLRKEMKLQPVMREGTNVLAL